MSIHRTVGAFEAEVLAAVLRIGPSRAHNYEVGLAIEDQTGERPHVGAVHVTLKRLERKGFLSAAWSTDTGSDVGRRRRLYSITGEGEAALRDACQEAEASHRRLAAALALAPRPAGA